MELLILYIIKKTEEATLKQTNKKRIADIK